MRFYTVLATMFGIAVTSMSPAVAADVESLPGGKTEKQGFAVQCLKDLEAFDEMLGKVGFGILPPYGYSAAKPSDFYVWGVQGTPRQKIRTLREAAYVYAFAGNEKLCQSVVASMRQVYDEHQKLVGTEADDRKVRIAWRKAHLARAKPVTEMDHLMRADVLIGSEIRNLEDEKLAEIEDLVLNPEKRNVLYVLASSGGFLGFGEKLIAIRWSDLRATQDHELYVLNVTPKAIEDAPAVDRRNFAKTANREWQNSLSEYWDRALR